MKALVKQWLFRALAVRGEYYARLPKGFERTCPICNYRGRFGAFGLYSIRPDAECLNCGSLERQRLLYLYIAKFKPFNRKSSVLHFAPEKAVTGFLKDFVGKYETADLTRRDVDHNWNIENINAKNGSFDGIVCSHVLEHVDCDKALAECRRILKEDGLALFMVPICEGLDITYKNSDANTDELRLLHFHQSDHVSVLGRDFRDRIRNAGFDLDEFVATGEISAEFSLTLGERIFIARPS